MGNKVNSHLIKKIEDSNGNVLYEYKNELVNILNENLVFILNEMLTYTYDKDFIDYNYPTLIGLLPKITNKYAIKSGTTDTDMWIIGYNQDVVLGIWTGYDDNRAIESGDSSFHKDIWIETMEGYFKEKETSWYDVPDNIVGVLVNPLTGEISKSGDKKKKLFYFLKGTEPHEDVGYDFESVFREDEHINKDTDKDDENNEGHINGDVDSNLSSDNLINSGDLDNNDMENLENNHSSVESNNSQNTDDDAVLNNGSSSEDNVNQDNDNWLDNNNNMNNGYSTDINDIYFNNDDLENKNINSDNSD